jgi:hypothetical protein
MDYFIDECGQTGDLARSSVIPSFGDQPVFTLAAIGIADEESLSQDIERLKAKHNIRLAELKSSALRERPEFTFDVARLVCDSGLPWFLEVMDKKFTIVTNIVTWQLLPPVRGYVEDARSLYVKNVIADYIFERAPDGVFATFLEACKSPSDTALRAQLDALIVFARSAPSYEEPSVAVLELATDTLNEYCDAVGEGTQDAYLRYLPIPDDNKHKKSVWILPSLAAFTNIYARINLYERGRLSDIRLIHDEQLQFDEILRKSKATAEELKDSAAEIYTPRSDFYFRESAPLSFANSTTSTGLQVADVFAGFCMRYVKDFFQDRDHVSPAAHRTYDLLRRHTDPVTGKGVNLVTSTGHHRALSLFVGA